MGRVKRPSNESFSAKERMNDVGSNFIDFSFGKLYVTRNETGKVLEKQEDI